MPKKPLIILGTVLAAIVLVAAVFLLFLRDQRPPEITLTPALGPVNAETELALAVRDIESGLRRVTVSLVQGETRKVLVDESPVGSPTTWEGTLELPTKTLQDGPFQLTVTATDASFSRWGKGRTATATAALDLDSTPPGLALASVTHNFNRGGSGLVLFSISEDVTRAGVLTGELFFPAYQLEDGRWACLFAFPYFMELADFKPLITARDTAGNETVRAFPFHANHRDFRRDTINISDRFLDLKMPEFRRHFPAADSNLDLFLKVNNELRTQNRESLREIGLRSVPRVLWQGPFLRMPNTATRSMFADFRTYMYKGEVIDQQYHLGVDLASVRQDEVPAAGSGTVAFAGDMGIYGQCVVLDHGLGLQTLYAHLSSILVEDGQSVSRGDSLGLTGMTGMAGGDHLHFAVTVSGLPVTPLEWWDDAWIRNNITGKLHGER